MRNVIVIFFLLLLASSCSEDAVPLPKPRLYPRINYPAKVYSDFDADYCNFSFKQPNYALIQKDSSYFDQKPLHPCWFDLYYADFDARIHFSYYPINSYERFEELKKDAFTLSQKHNIVANYIDEIPVHKSETVKGFIFSLEGEVASPIQFYLSDERKNFLRGALYFNTQARPDSLAPLVTFIKEDILKLVETFDWSEE